MPITLIRNGTVVTPWRIIPGGCVQYEGDTILYAGEELPGLSRDEEVDAGGRWVSPGFIDLHVHGGGGADFMDGTAEDFIVPCETHARFGTTALYPTTTSAECKETRATLTAYREAQKKGYCGARMEGLHLEGPYLSMAQRGAQDPGSIRPPNPGEYLSILDLGDDIRRWSIAPELEGAREFAMACRKRGILPAIAHSDAVYDQVADAFSWGFSLVTHLYSGCSTVRRIQAYRHAGVVESAFLLDAMDVEVIADGHHLPQSLLRLILKNKDKSRIALVTDATRGAGTGERTVVVGPRESGVKAIIENGVAKLPDRSAFAGSVATSNRLLQVMVEVAGVPVEHGIEMLSATPARIMGIHGKTGSLVKGKLADITVFDRQFRVFMTVVGGRTVYQNM